MTANKFAFASAIAAATLAFTGSASALTLNTTGLKSDSVLTFTIAAYGSSTAANISFKAFGNMTRLADVTVNDPETNTPAQVPQFNQPITKADISVTSSLAIVPNSGAAIRSGLQINRGKLTASLANFNVDFNKKIVYADIFTPSGTTAQAAIFTFKDNGDLKISFKGLVLNQSQSISNLVFTQQTQDILATSLALSAPLKATLATQDWGTIAVKVTSFKRSPAVSNKPLTPADVPAVVAP
jgi:hypothetical protein